MDNKREQKGSDDRPDRGLAQAFISLSRLKGTISGAFICWKIIHLKLNPLISWAGERDVTCLKAFKRISIRSETLKRCELCNYDYCLRVKMGEKAWKTGGWPTSAQLYAWFLKGIDFGVDKSWTCDGSFFCMCIWCGQVDCIGFQGTNAKLACSSLYVCNRRNCLKSVP